MRGTLLRRVLVVLIASVSLLANGAHVVHAATPKSQHAHHHAGADAAMTAAEAGPAGDHAELPSDGGQTCCPLACAAVMLPAAIVCGARVGLSDSAAEFPQIAPRQAAAPPVRPPRPSV